MHSTWRISAFTNYDYDRTGNRLYEDVVGGQRTDYTYNALDQMTSISIDSGPTLVYGYDGRGNMISAPDGKTYAYDAMDRLIDVDLPDTTHIDYTYDWDGRRIQKDVDSGTEVINYLWDEFSTYGDVVLETDDTNAVLGNYTLANSQLISQTRNSVDRFYLADGQGSIRALVDDAATVNVTDNYTYKAFGDILTLNQTTENPYQYTGQQYDDHLGLYSLRARYYAPTDGRFLSRDKLACPLCDPTELNRYVYATNNPIRFSDPTGFCVSCIGYGVGTIQRTAPSIGALLLLGAVVLLIVKELIDALEDIDVWPWPRPNNAKQWTCVAKCQIVVHATQSSHYFTGPPATGSSQEQACRAAKQAANAAIPAAYPNQQVYKRHCRCICTQK